MLVNNDLKLLETIKLIIVLIFFLLIIVLFNDINNNKCENLNSIEFSRCYEIGKNFSKFIKTFGKTKPSKENIKQSNSFEIKNEWIVDQYYNDFIKYKDEIQFINNLKIEKIQELITNNLSYNSFDDFNLRQILNKHLVNNKKYEKSNIGILNWFETDYEPWIESVLLLDGATKITNIDMTQKVYEHESIQSIYLLNDNLNLFQQFDVIISYFSIENIGLGKFGEDLAFNADLDTINLIKCILNKNGLVFLTLSTSFNENESFINFNTNRIFGKNRLNELFSSNFAIIDSVVYKFGSTQLFVLKKT
jgi:hypothetical protein